MSEDQKRSEELRLKRIKNGKPRRIQPVTRTKSSLSRSIPATVTRKDSDFSKERKRKRKGARERKAFNLPQSGVELRMPSIPKLNFNWVTFSGILALLSLASILIIFFSKVTIISDIRVLGLERMSPESMIINLDILGSSILDLTPEELELHFPDLFPEITETKITIELPAIVTITVKERFPVVLWSQAGVQAWIDGYGYSFPVHGEADWVINIEATGSPITGPNDDPNKPIKQEMVSAIMDLNDYIPDNSILIYDPVYGLGWQDEGGWLVYIGFEADGIDVRLEVYQEILKDLEATNIHPVLINVAYIHTPYYRTTP
jgi:cell division septal protein FtsQ